MTALCSILCLAAAVWMPPETWREHPDPSASPRARRGGTIRFNGGQPPKSLNAYVDNNTYTTMMFELLYETLIGVDPETNDLVPLLARRWSVSDDGHTFTFELDGRAKWSDGVEVSADDVKWTFDTVMDPQSDTGPWKSMLGSFASPEIVGARTIRFRHASETSGRDWRDLLNCGRFWILPRHAFARTGLAKADLVGAVTGGPYQIERFSEQIETVYRRRDTWWREGFASERGLYNFDRIVMRYYADNENAFEAFKQRAIDVYPVYTARILATGTRGEKFGRNWILKRAVRNAKPIGFQGFAMNQRRPPFDDVRVRRAMAMLLDRETMNRTLMNGAYFLHRSYFEDLYSGRENEKPPLIAFDPKGAAALLDAAGWTRGADGLRVKDGRPFRFTFLSRSSTEDKFLAFYSRALAEAGVRMEIERKDFASWMRDMDDFHFDMTWAAWGAGRIRNPELQWSSAEADRRGSNNITGFRNAEVDRLIAAEKTMGTMREREAAYRRIDALVAAEVPYALLWNTDTTRLLYWNKFGAPDGLLSLHGDEDSVFPYWWYDEDRAAELKDAIDTSSSLPAVPYEIDISTLRR